MLQTTKRNQNIFLLLMVQTFATVTILKAQSTNNIQEKITTSNIKGSNGLNKSSSGSGETGEADQNTRFYPSLPLNDINNNPTYSSSFTPMNGFYPMDPHNKPQLQPYSYLQQQLQPQPQYQFQNYHNPYNAPPQFYSNFPQNHPHAHHGHQRGILFPLPLGNYPPYFDPNSQTSSATVKPQTPYPSSSPYPVQQIPQYYPQPQPQPQPQYPPPYFQQPYPQSNPNPIIASPNQYNTEGFDVGSLPQQVKVPGTIVMKYVGDTGKDVEIYCEFPKYIIIIQGIFWHHKYDDPFGSYFDTQNGFGPHVQVQSIDKWSSKLVIKDFSPHDEGTYKCLSAAVLPPADDQGNRFRHPHSGDGHGDFHGRTNNLLLNPPIHEFQARESKSSSEELLKATEDNYANRNQRPTTPRSRKIKFIGNRRSRDTSAYEYDPFEMQSHHGGHGLESIGRIGFFNNLFNSVSEEPGPSDYPAPVPLPPPPVSISHHRDQNGRHIIFGGDQPPQNFATSSTQGPIAPNPNEPFGLKLPYYKPSYTVYTIYQEIKVSPPNPGRDYGYNNNNLFGNVGRRSRGNRNHRFHRFL